MNILAYIYLANSNSSITDKGLVQNKNVIIGIMLGQYVVFTLLTIFIDTYKFKNFKNVKAKTPLIQNNPQNPDFSGIEIMIFLDFQQNL